MQKLYGDQIRKEAGLTKTLRTAAQNIPKKLPHNVLQEIEKFVHEQQQSGKNDEETTTIKLDHVVQKTVAKVEKVFGDTVDTISKAELAAALEATKFLDGSSSSDSEDEAIAVKKEYSLKLSHFHHRPDNHPTSEINVFTMGERIKVDWIAPEDHGPKDWVGIYKLTDNPSKQTTTASSRGKWYWTNAVKPSGKDDQVDEVGFLFPPQVELKTSGSIVFKGDKLPWREGTYEIRYHHDGKHKVMARSIPFEITGNGLLFCFVNTHMLTSIFVILAPATPDTNDEDAIQLCLLRLIQSALENDPEKMPMSPIDSYTYLDESSAKKLAYAIKIIFGVEFAWEVIVADTTVNRLTKRVQHALNALSPFSYHRRSSLSSISSMPSLSTAAANAAHPIAIAIQNQQQTIGKRASIDELYDIHENHLATAGDMQFGSSPIKQSPLHQ
jgi:phosphatidylethanolamine N-methyltransferase